MWHGAKWEELEGPVYSPKENVLPVVGWWQDYLMVGLIVFAMRVGDWILHYLVAHELGFDGAVGWIDSQCAPRWPAPPRNWRSKPNPMMVDFWTRFPKRPGSGHVRRWRRHSGRPMRVGSSGRSRWGESPGGAPVVRSPQYALE